MFAVFISAACLLKDRKENRMPANKYGRYPAIFGGICGASRARVTCQTRSHFPGESLGTAAPMKPSMPFSSSSLARR